MLKMFQTGLLTFVLISAHALTGFEALSTARAEGNPAAAHQQHQAVRQERRQQHQAVRQQRR